MAHVHFKNNNVVKIMEAIKNEDAAMLRFLAPMEAENRRFWNGGIKNELPLEVAMKCKNFEIVKEITPYIAIAGDDYYLRKAVTVGDIDIFKHIFEIGTDQDKEWNCEWIQKHNIFEEKNEFFKIDPIFWRQVRQCVKKDE